MSSSLAASAIERRTLAEAIADHIKQHILSQNLPPGTRLPSERELCQAFQASRVTVREAIKRLEGEGLVVLRPGAAGGVLVADPDPTRLRDAFAAFCQLQQVPTASLIEFRLVLEQAAARWAALRASPEDIRRLEERVEAMEDALTSVEDFQELDIAFHTGIAEAAGNLLFARVMHAVRYALKRAILEGFAQVEEPTPVLARLAQEHRTILDAIRAGDADAAEQAIAHHIRDFYAAVLQGP